jgi:hypothetical protein
MSTYVQAYTTNSIQYNLTFTIDSTNLTAEVTSHYIPGGNAYSPTYVLNIPQTITTNGSTYNVVSIADYVF